MEDLLIFGLAAFAFVVAVRVALQSFGRLGFWFLLHKPVSCDLCLSFWASLALYATTRALDLAGVVRVFAAAGVSLLLLKVKERLER